MNNCVLPCLFHVFSADWVTTTTENFTQFSSWKGREVIPICSSWNKRILLERCTQRAQEILHLPSLKLTTNAPENGWLEYFFVSFWGKRPIFRCFAVSFRECTICRICCQAGLLCQGSKCGPFCFHAVFSPQLSAPQILPTIILRCLKERHSAKQIYTKVASHDRDLHPQLDFPTICFVFHGFFFKRKLPPLFLCV